MVFKRIEAMSFFGRLEERGHNAWLRVLKWVSNSIASLFGAISAAYAAYPHSVGDFIERVPKWLVFPAAIATFWFIHGVIKRAGKAPTDAGQNPS
jgi:hypothetical protein